jgi:hypothetical protein
MTDSDIRTLKRLSDDERFAARAYLSARGAPADALVPLKWEWTAAALTLGAELAIILAKDPNGIRHVYAEEMRRTA